MAQNKQKFRSPRRYMPGTKLPDPATKAVEDRLFELQRTSQNGRRVRFYLSDENNPHSGLRGLHIVKLSEDDLSPHGISFDVYDADSDTEIPYWDMGMDFESFDFILALDHSADDGSGGSGADILRFSRAADDSVSGSSSTKAILSYRAGSPSAMTSFFTVEAGDTLAGINLSVKNSASGRSSITITQRDANRFGAISFDNAVRIGCDYLNANAATFFIRDDIAAAHRLWMDSSGRFAIGGSTSPTAYLHLPAGTAAASSAPLKFTSGTNMGTPEAGAFEFDGSELYFTRSTTRLKVLMDTMVAGTTVNTNGGDIICKQVQMSEGFRGSGQPTRFLKNTITPASDADVTVSTPDSDYVTQVLATGAWTAGHNVILPTQTEATYIVRNTTAFNAVFKTAAGTGVTVAAGMRAIIQCGGANYIRITADAS